MTADPAAAPLRTHWLAAALSALVVALGVTVVLGWHVHNPRITQWVTGKSPMVYNTGVSLVVLAGALLAASMGRRRVATLVGTISAVPSLLTLFEYVSGISLGIDGLLMQPGDASAYPGRIAPNTAVCLVLLAAAVLFMTRRKVIGGSAIAGPLTASVALGISAVSLAGYMTGFATFGWSRFIPMALPTSVGLAMLSLAALALTWRVGNPPGGIPSWLWMTVTVAAMVMSVSIWQALAAEEHVGVQRTVASQLETVRVSLLDRIDSRVSAVTRFARRWEGSGKPIRERWEFEAGLLLKDVQGFQAIGWADPSFRVRWVYPHEGNQALLNADLSYDMSRRTALEAARNLRQPIVTRPIRLLAGGMGIHVYVPIYQAGLFQGFIVGAFRFQDLFMALLDRTLAPGYAIAIYDRDERIYLRGSPNEQVGRVWEQQAPIQIENARWTLKLWPAPSALAPVDSSVSNIVLAAGLLLSLLLGSAIHLAQAARVKTKLAEQACGELATEVGQRHRAEQELDQFFRLAPDMLCIAGFDGYFKRINAAWERVLGIPLEALLAEPFANFVHPDDLASTRQIVENQKAGSTISSFENRYRAKDGSYRWLRWNSLPALERQLFFAAARDVTAEKAADEALHRLTEELEDRIQERTADLEQANRALYQSEEMFRRLFEDSPIGTALIGLDRRVSHVNKALCELLGYDPSGLTGLRLEDVTCPADLQSGEKLLQQVIGGQTPRVRLTKRLLRKDGAIVWTDLTATTLRDQQGIPITMLVMIENVTERQRHDEEIASLNRELQARVGDLTTVNQELESFNYSISHDLRAPLRHIDGFSKILEEEHGSQIPDDARRYFDLIREAARRMGRMVDELLELSRTSRKDVVTQPTMLRSLVDDVMAELEPETAGRDIKWCIGELPFVDCDPHLVHQVFANLLANAVKFSRTRKRAVIEVGQARRQGRPVLFVRDNGVGFSMKYADKLFGVFQRLHRREDFEGTGVGLATVQRIVRKHGGMIWAEAELDKGATFYFTLNSADSPLAALGREETAVLAGTK